MLGAVKGTGQGTGKASVKGGGSALESQAPKYHAGKTKQDKNPFTEVEGSEMSGSQQQDGDEAEQVEGGQVSGEQEDQQGEGMEMTSQSKAIV